MIAMYFLRSFKQYSVCACVRRLTIAEYHEQEEIFKLRLGHLKKVNSGIMFFSTLTENSSPLSRH